MSIDLRLLSHKLQPGDVVKLTDHNGCDQYVLVRRSAPLSSMFQVLTDYQIGTRRQEARGKRWWVELDEVMARGVTA